MQTKASSQVDDENGEIANQELVSSDSDEHDQAVEEEERHASDHKRFMQRLHQRELA
jgi:hypothetical protein